jgi:NAD(P)H-hydrate epimerase
MRAAEEAAFARGITAEALMDEAAAGIARMVCLFFPDPGRCIVFAGKGNNAGDAFAAAELLHANGWEIDLRLSFAEPDCGELARKKVESLRKALERGRGLSAPIPSAKLGVIGALRPLPHSSIVILDGLLGLGATLPLREPIASACREINHLRDEQNAFVFAIDLPTGLEGDNGDADADCVIADFTVTIGFAKQGSLADRAIDHIGRLEVVPLSELTPAAATTTARPRPVVATATSLRSLIPRRNFSAYKNQFGRIGIVAGSRGLTGAAILCASGALRAGAGLVELFVTEDVYPIIAVSAPPEAMVKPVASYGALLDEKIDVWAVGPGLGREHSADIAKLIANAHEPMVIDADALNITAQDTTILKTNAGPRLLTPHPGEMSRLMDVTGKSRAETASEFCAQYPVTLLLKGSRTIVAESGRAASYNTTGNPAMSTGGMGDVLTGVCAALIGQSLSPYDAARLGAWVCGRAAEIAIFHGSASQESLLPQGVLSHLGAAFDDLRDA